jgi:uncharacterized protein DUF4124
MTRAAAALISAAALALTVDAQAQLFKCVGADGKTSYQSEPCPTSAKEQRLSVQPPAAASGEEAADTAAMKPGWDQREIIFMADVCAKAIIEPARKDYDARLQPFPEAQLTASVDRHCSCIARRASRTYNFIDYTKDPVRSASRLSAEAFKGGECKPEGLHAELLRKAGKLP